MSRSYKAVFKYLSCDACSFFNELDSFAFSGEMSSRDIIEGFHMIRVLAITTTIRPLVTADTAYRRILSSFLQTIIKFHKILFVQLWMLILLAKIF